MPALLFMSVFVSFALCMLRTAFLCTGVQVPEESQIAQSWVTGDCELPSLCSGVLYNSSVLSRDSLLTAILESVDF